MISFKSVNLQYENTINSHEFALKNINLQIKKGECVLICGTSGCGKTSIARIINGLIPNYFNIDLTGDIYIQNQNIYNLDMITRAHFTGSVFQNPKTQFFNQDVISEIAFTSQNLGISPKIIEQQVQKQILDFNLKELKNKLLHQMSGGQKQLIACASASANNQNLLVLDEPSSNLDDQSIEKLKKIIAMWKSQGRTIMIFEHRLYFLKELIDQVFIVDQGSIIKQYSQSEFVKLSDDNLNSMGLRALNPIQTKPKINKSTIASSIQISNLEVKYNKKTALSIANLSMQYHGICAIVGHNGAGKSTFINALAGLVKSKKSQITINQKRYSPKALQNASYIVSQDVTHQLFCESVYEEVTCGKNISVDKVEKILKELKLNHKKDVHPMALSGGQKQRLAIAVALAINKDIIFFDEPTSGLDYENMLKTSKLINELSLQKKTIFVITHDIEFIINACNHIIHFDDGKYIDDFPLKDSKKLLEIFKEKSEYNEI